MSILEDATRMTLDIIADYFENWLGIPVSRNEVIDVEAIEVTEDEDGNTDNH